jgi:hypothetical protein
MDFEKVWGDREFHAHSDYVFSFVINCLCVENKFEKEARCKFFRNLTMRVSLMGLNLFARNKYNSKLKYINL